MNPALAPLFVLGVDILGHEEHVAIDANQLVCGLIGTGRNQRKIRTAVGRCDFDPSMFARGRAVIHDQFETQLVHVESQASVQITNVNHYVLDTQVRVFAAGAKHASVRP